MWILHRCPGGDNRRCCNPGHLYLGTVTDNNRDSRNAGHNHFSTHFFKGERHANAKLTQAQVDQIRALWDYSRIAYGQQTKIAKMFGVTRYAIYRIIHGDNWVH
jgi:hypothetical protein